MIAMTCASGSMARRCETAGEWRTMSGDGWLSLALEANTKPSRHAQACSDLNRSHRLFHHDWLLDAHPRL